MTSWAVLGSSGFVGSAVAAAIEQRGDDVKRVRAPRVATAARRVADLRADADGRAVDDLATALSGCEVVVNAAGAAAPDEAATDALFGANALLPVLVARAAAAAGVRRYVHVSSQSVLGDVPVLTEDAVWHPFSPYSASKALGERALYDAAEPGELSIFRALSVQGAGRHTTRSLVSFARSRMAAVSVDAPTPLTLIENTAAAIVFLGAFDGPVPRIVLQRDDGLTTREALRLLGASRVRMIPRLLARPGVVALRTAGRFSERFLGLSRRAELMLFGQQTRALWMTQHGFEPVAGPDAWRALGNAVAAAPPE